MKNFDRDSVDPARPGRAGGPSSSGRGHDTPRFLLPIAASPLDPAVGGPAARTSPAVMSAFGTAVRPMVAAVAEADAPISQARRIGRPLRILFLSHYFPPEVNVPASRTFEHCRAWARAGAEVTVVTCAPNHPAGRIYPGHKNRLWHEATVQGVRVIRLWTYLAPNERVFRRTLNYLSYMLSGCIAAPFLPAADVVVSTSPQLFCGLAGYLVSRIKRAPWVLEIRDLWPEAIHAVGAIRNQLVIGALEKIERWAYRKADRLITVTHAFQRYIETRCAHPGRVAVVTNGVNLDLFSVPRRDPELERELGLTGKFVVGYFGTLGMAHRLETALEAARLLRDEPGIAFLIVGDGAERARLERLRAGARPRQRDHARAATPGAHARVPGPVRRGTRPYAQELRVHPDDPRQDVRGHGHGAAAHPGPRRRKPGDRGGGRLRIPDRAREPGGARRCRARAGGGPGAQPGDGSARQSSSWSSATTAASSPASS